MCFFDTWHKHYSFVLKYVSTPLHLQNMCKIPPFSQSLQQMGEDAKATGFIIPPTPQMALLKKGIHSVSTQFRPLITHILIVTKLTITSKWKSTKAPNVSEVIQRVQLRYTYEKHFAMKSQNLPKFNFCWNPWTASHPVID